jgi:hypothetical protein
MSSLVTDDKGAVLRFNAIISLGDLGAAAKAYDALIFALEHRKPTWNEFTDYLQQQGYVEKEEKK